MPPKHKTQEERNKVRRKILDCALDMTAKKGYDALSMRKIASMVGTSATTIYSYFHDKDEVYLAMLTEGYELLYQETNEAANRGLNSIDRFERMIRAYVHFALSREYYYEIMFSSHTPKYLDYVGLPSEQMAYNKKTTAFKWVNCVKECVAECLAIDVHSNKAMIVTLQIMGQLHGVINLYHNRIIIETYENPLEVIDETIESVMKKIKKN